MHGISGMRNNFFTVSALIELASMLESSPQYHGYEYAHQAVELWLLYHLLSEKPLFGHDIGADLDQHYYAAV